MSVIPVDTYRNCIPPSKIRNILNEITLISLRDPKGVTKQQVYSMKADCGADPNVGSDSKGLRARRIGMGKGLESFVLPPKDT